MRAPHLLALALLAGCAHAPSPTSTPFEPTAFSVKVSGAGQAVVFIPGLATSGEVWDATLAHLGAGVQAHVITIAGFAGQPPEKLSGPLLTEVRDQLARYLRERHLKAIIVGHSLGAALAWWLASADPDVVAGVVAVDAPPYGVALDSPTVTEPQFEPQARKISDGLRAATPAQFHDDVRARFQRMIGDPTQAAHYAEAAERSSRPAMADAIYQLYTLDLRADAAKIQAPVLVLVAKLDVSAADWPAYLAAWHAQIDRVPHAQMVIIENAHHYVMLDAPDRFQQALDAFLEPARARSAP